VAACSLPQLLKFQKTSTE
ncbi:unnamed protein product, partial [Allacma fusca]